MTYTKLRMRIKTYNRIRDNEEMSKIIRLIASIYSKYYTYKWERWYD